MIPDNLIEFGLLVMGTPETEEKAKLTKLATKLRKEGKLKELSNKTFDIPEEPARPDNVKIVNPSKIRIRSPKSEIGRKTMLHFLAHMESYAIDISWSIIVNFGHELDEKHRAAFFDDWLKVADDEANHFTWLTKMMKEKYNIAYGDYEAHSGLWQSCSETAHSLEARLVILHCVHEARGLDVSPGRIAKVRETGEHAMADMLQTIFEEEIDHVYKGVKWFKEVAGKDADNDSALAERFHDIVKKHFRGSLKPPFDYASRDKAQMPRIWYEPLTNKED